MSVFPLSKKHRNLLNNTLSNYLKQSDNKVIHILEHTEIDGAENLATALVEHAKNQKNSQIVWLAPQILDSTSLKKAEQKISTSGNDFVIFYYPQLFESLFLKTEQITEQRQLLLPFDEQEWVGLESLARMFEPTENKSIVFVKGKVYQSKTLASELTTALEAMKQKENFLRAQFERMDLDKDGLLSVTEIYHFLTRIGFSQSEVETLVRLADKNNDGYLQYDEFVGNMPENIAEMLAFVDSQINFIKTSELQYQDFLMESEGCSRYDASELVKGMMAYPRLGTTPLPPKKEDEHQDFSDWIAKHVLTFLGVDILPGKGLFYSRPTKLKGFPAIKTQIIYPDGRNLSSLRNPNEVQVHWETAPNASHWTRLPFSSEEFTFQLTLEDNLLRGIEVSGKWSGLPEAMGYIISEKTIPKWQQSILKELGSFHVEENSVQSPDKMICNCLQLCLKDFTPLIEAGDNQLETLVKTTKATTVCGGCEPLVEELCGLSNMMVATIEGKKTTENKDIQCITLKPVDQEVKPFKPGQHLVLQAYIQNQWVTRAYSLISSGAPNTHYEIAVKREELGTFSRWLIDHGDENAILRISEPKGSYFLESTAHEIVFFAAGIGITPAISMLRSMTTNNDQRPFKLEWSAPYTKNFILNEEFAFYTKQKNIHINRWATRTNGRISEHQIKTQYPYHPNSVAFLCGPEAYMNTIRKALLSSGWPESNIRSEQFNAAVDKEGELDKPLPSSSRSSHHTSKKEAVETVESDSFFLQPIADIKKEATLFLTQFYHEKKLSQEALKERINEVEKAIQKNGSYEHTIDELTFASRVAWRNSSRCVGRYFWGNMIVRDCRDIDQEEAVYTSLVEHLRLGINNGNLRAVISIFRNHDPIIRLYNPLLLMFAGYEQADGSILGDPATVELTKIALGLGWTPKGAKSRFDPLPLVLEVDGRTPQFFEWPDDIVKTIPIEHPDFDWFANLKLEWFMVPAVAGMALDAGGIQYRCAPSNGFFISTEVGARDLGDTSRYNMLPVVAEKMGLDMSSDETHWKDRAIIELNLAVQWSYRKHQIRMLDHHTIVDYFMKFHGQELEAGRSIHADWKWIVPPISGSAVEAFHMDMVNKIIKPNYYYQEDPWKSNDWRKFSKV